MDISTLNPWWNEGGLWQDTDLKRIKNSPILYHPKPFSAADCDTSNVYTLRGPRRAGKTVSLKLLIAELIEKKKWDPQKIAWLSFDTIRTLNQAQEILESLQKKMQPKLIFIDEATSLRNWTLLIKKLRDDGTLADTCLILSGSSAYDLKSGAERMAGRRGDGDDRILLPMDYKNFCAVVPKEKATTENYLKCGGFPFRVENFVRNPDWTPTSDQKTFDEVLFYEFTRRRLERSIGIEIIGRLSQIGCTSCSYDGFAKALSITKDTAKKYLDALGDCFLLSTFYSYDTSRNKVALKKDKKFLWIDPALAWSSVWLEVGPELSEAVRAEIVVGAELLRRYEKRLFEGLSSPRNVFTWKSSSGNEIDFLVLNRATGYKLPVEVKWQKTISDWDHQVMEKAFKKGILVTPNTNKNKIYSDAMDIGSFLNSEIKDTTK